MACAILNRPAVRTALTERGIAIPADTVFVPAEHDTATDRVRLLDLWAVPQTHRADLERLKAELGAAGVALASTHGDGP